MELGPSVLTASKYDWKADQKLPKEAQEGAHRQDRRQFISLVLHAPIRPCRRDWRTENILTLLADVRRSVAAKENVLKMH